PTPPQVLGSVGVIQSRKVTSYTITFNTPLNSASATNVALYQVLQGVKKVVKKHKQTLYTKPLPIKTVVYNPGPNTVTITLAKPYKGRVQFAIRRGLEGADGASGNNMNMVVPWRPPAPHALLVEHPTNATSPPPSPSIPPYRWPESLHQTLAR